MTRAMPPPDEMSSSSAIGFRAHRSLQTRVARHIAFAVVVSLVASALALTWVRQISIRRAMEESARTYASLITLQVVDAARMFQTTGRHILRQRLDRFLSMNPDVIRLEVVDVDGLIIMRADRSGVETFAEDDAMPVVDAELLDAVRGLETVATRIGTPDDGRTYRVVAPAVEEWGRHSYSLVAVFSYRGLDRQITHSLWLVLAMLLIGLVLANRVSVVLARTITRNVGRLQEGVQRIQEGHLDERVEVDSGDEIQELAEAFNTMADKLLQTIERLREANRELEKLDQAKVDLVANVSHELKTPLTALRGYLELLAQGDLGELGASAERAVEVCQRNVRRLSLRIEELVQLSQLEKRGFDQLTMEMVRIDQLLHSAVETLEPRFSDRGVVCTLNLATDLPMIWGSPEQIERIFLNLLDNASKFTSEGGFVRVAAEPFVRDRKEGVLVRVADTGVGIPANELLRIFDRFYQVDPSARRRYGGMGLGLSLVRAIIEAHRGRVWVESEVDRGSTFFVWLPSRSVEESSGAHARRLSGSSSSARLQASKAVAPEGGS